MSRLYRLVLCYPSGTRVVVFDAIPADVVDSQYRGFVRSAQSGVAWSTVRVECTDGRLIDEYRARRVV